MVNRNETLKVPVLFAGAELLELRILQPEDVTSVYVDWMNDRDVVRFTEQRHVRHDMAEIASFVAQKLVSPTDYLFGIFLAGTHVGNIKLGPVDKLSKVASISYIVGNRSVWGRGIATRAIAAIVRFAFDELGLEKITAGSYAENTGSIRALEKNGFRREGCQRAQTVLDDKRIDVVIFGLLRGEEKDPATR